MTNDGGGGESENAQGKSVPVPGLMQVASLGNSISGTASLLRIALSPSYTHWHSYCLFIGLYQ